MKELEAQHDDLVFLSSPVTKDGRYMTTDVRRALENLVSILARH